jgi:predicted nucleotidyltransferase
MSDRLSRTTASTAALEPTPGAPPSLSELRRRAGELTSLAERHRARRVRVVGSVARGEAGPESDVDLLVDFHDDASLLDIVALERAFADLLGCRVDVLDAGAFLPETRVVGPDNAARRARIRQALEREAHTLR